MQATYTKLRDGSWGIRVHGAVDAGATVTVYKRDGSAKAERVGRVVWRDGAASICTLAASAAPAKPHRAARSTPRRARELAAGEQEIYRDTRPYKAGDAAQLRGSEDWLIVVACGQRRISELEDDTREGQTRYWAHARAATYEEAVAAQARKDDRAVLAAAKVAAAKALEAGERLARDTSPGGRRIAAEYRAGSLASLPYLIAADDGTVYHVRPVYDDSPMISRLALTVEQAIDTARTAGWRVEGC